MPAKKTKPALNKSNLNKLASSSKSGLTISVLIAGAVLAGGVINGLIFDRNPSPATHQSEAEIEAYIRANPELILKVLQDYALNKQQDDFQAAIDSVKSHSVKTAFGNPDGDVTIYEFADYNCPYCKRSFAELAELVREDGDIRVVVIEFPVLDASSMDAALLGVAAAELGKYEELHTALMQWHGRIDDDVLAEVAANLDLDADALKALTDSESTRGVINENRELAQRLNINGTPAFVIGDQLIPGAIPKAEIKKLIAETRQKKS